MFHTATMSYDEIRWALYESLEERFPCVPDAGGKMHWPMVLDVFDGFCVAKLTVDGKYKAVKLVYTIDAEDTVALVGDPEPVQRAWLIENTEQVVVRQMAARLIAEGDEAKTYLDNLVKTNPLFAALENTPNTHLVVFDLTTLGRPSQHAGKVKFQLAKSGFKAAAASLLSKPIHVTDDLDAHFDGDPKPIGAFLGCEGIDNADGTITVRAIGTLWEGDFPAEVEEIADRKAELGASYEITYNPLTASRIAAEVIEITDYLFSGGAILTKKAAAHPETRVLVASTGYRTVDGLDFNAIWFQKAKKLLKAGNVDVLDEGDPTTKAPAVVQARGTALGDADFAVIETVDGDDGSNRVIRRFPCATAAQRQTSWARISDPTIAASVVVSARAAVHDMILGRAKRESDAWATPYTKSHGTWKKEATAMSTKYPGFTLEQEAAIDGFITAAVSAAKPKAPAPDDEKAQAALVAITEKVTALEAAAVTAQNTITEMTAQLATATTALEEATTKAVAAEAKDAKAELDKKVDAKLAELGTRHGFDAKQLQAKRPIVEKLIAGKEAITPEEADLLYGDAKRVKAPMVPLFAGGGDANQVDRAAVVAAFPAIGRALATSAKR